MAPDPKLLEKLKKLFTFQADSEKRNSLAEAANAAQRIQDLLIKNNLSMSDIEGRLNEPDDIEVERVFLNMADYGYNKRYGKWKEQLMYGVCKYNLCYLIVHDTDTGVPVFAIIGRPENLEIVKFLFDQIVTKAKESEKYEWSRYRGPEQHGMWRRGYLMGFALGIGSKLKEQIANAVEAEAKSNPGSGKITALVKVHDLAIKSFIDNKYQNLKKARKHGNGSDAVTTGYTNGRNTSLNKGLETNSINQKMLS